MTPVSIAMIEKNIGALRLVDQPIETAAGLPNDAYTSDAFAALERDAVLGRSWACIGVGSQVAEPGDVRPVTLLGLPLILLRDLEGEIQVFHNVCSHRGVELVQAPCRSKGTLRCPYHSWTYHLNGDLRSTPFIGGPGTTDCDGFDKTQHGLKPVRSAVWFDAVFVNLSGDAPDFADFVAPLAERWRDFDAGRLRHGGADSRFQVDVACNWKLAVENYCEAYHLPWIHPGLNSYSRLEDHYDIECDGHFAGQGSLAYRPALNGNPDPFPAHPGLPEKWIGAAEYIALFPNVLFGIHADHFYTVCLLPVTEDRTIEHFEIYYFGDDALDIGRSDLRQANTEQWLTVFEEDRGVVEAMQRGRASPAFRGGAFSPVMDRPTHCFHKWVASKLTALTNA